MASRTRERLIDVARQLFARQGIENTTMNDIATASDRGRRTIYTYFRTKSEIYQAVIENEVARILQELDAKVAVQDTPGHKLRALIEYRMAVAMNNPHGYETWLKSLFNRDAKRADQVREKVTSRLYGMIDQIVDEGIRTGAFEPTQARRLPAMLTMMVRSADSAAGDWSDSRRSECIDFIVNAVEINKEHV